MAYGVHLSKSLAKLLRHDAKKRGLPLTPDGYANVDDILRLREFTTYDEDDIVDVVDNDKKGRFAKRNVGSCLQIKATQGHSLGVSPQVVRVSSRDGNFKLSDPNLEPITHASQARSVMHGTRERNMESIRKSGISKMNRDHIHFAPGFDAKSGIPSKCDMVIEIDIEKALRDGIKFYKSENGVILSPGDRNGCIPTKYFKSAYTIGGRKSIQF